MKKAKFVAAKPMYDGKSFATSRENRSLSQREKLEEAILNLAASLGIYEIERVVLNDRAGTQYAIPKHMLQSASNTIVSLSRMALERAQAK